MRLGEGLLGLKIFRRRRGAGRLITGDPSKIGNKGIPLRNKRVETKRMNEASRESESWI
jgi:hypothetical protein